MEWISVKDKLPKVSPKFNESEDILCFASGCMFVGWYNSKLDQWFVSHFLAETVPLSFHNIPSYWMPLPKPPKK